MTRVPVYVRILDVNDNAPQFAVFYDTFVCENARAGQVSHLRNCFQLFGFVMGTGTKSFVHNYVSIPKEWKIAFESRLGNATWKERKNGCQKISFGKLRFPTTSTCKLPNDFFVVPQKGLCALKTWSFFFFGISMWLFSWKSLKRQSLNCIPCCLHGGTRFKLQTVICNQIWFIF